MGGEVERGRAEGPWRRMVGCCCCLRRRGGGGAVREEEVAAELGAEGV